MIAVNNFRDWSLYWTKGWAVPDDFNYSAFAERATFLEGYIYTQAAAEAPQAAFFGHMLLFRNRLQLNNAIFQWAHTDALQAAAGLYGVRFLLVDRVHNRASSRLGTIARLVFANHDAQVYAVPHAATALAATRRRSGPPRSLAACAPALPMRRRASRLARPTAASITRKGSIPARKRMKPVMNKVLASNRGTSQSHRGACRTR